MGADGVLGWMAVVDYVADVQRCRQSKDKAQSTIREPTESGLALD